MPHWRTAQDEKDFLYSYNLDGKEFTLTIKTVVPGELIGEKGKTSKKPIATFEETPKKLALNTTNCKVIQALYKTADYTQWAGKRITIYATTTQMGPDVVDCIRVRQVIPAPKKAPADV
jgi:hypothetical protein